MYFIYLFLELICVCIDKFFLIFLIINGWRINNIYKIRIKKESIVILMMIELGVILGVV